jgi:integrase
MAASIKDKTNRGKLPIRAKEPYWHFIAEGQHLGYRKTGADKGTWIARYYTPQHKRRFKSLGVADDTVVANRTHILNFKQALAAAQGWIAETARADAAGVVIGPYTVGDACDDYLKTHTGKSGATFVKLHIKPVLGSIELHMLTKAKLIDWLDELAVKPYWRTENQKSKKPFDITDPETQRKRKDSANRVLNTLKAILNYARAKGHIESDSVWVGVESFKNVAKARTEYLPVEDGKRFIEACAADFADLVYGALYTGCRYSELCRMTVRAYIATNRAMSLKQGKTGKTKIVYLTDEGAAFFDGMVEGKGPDELIFRRADGEPWKHSNQKERMKAALKAAKITEDITFNNLRHTFASLLAMNNTPMPVIANQLGHTSTRMAEKHYAHLAPSYLGNIVRANMPSYSDVATESKQAKDEAV